MLEMVCRGYHPQGAASSEVDIPCTRAAVDVVVAGCAHEHVQARELCDWHRADVRDGRMLCGDCLDHPTHPHQCVLIGAPARPTEGRTTRA